MAAAPIKTAGIASAIHPKEATNDNVCARPGERDDNTRWKYTCHGIPPQIYHKQQQDILLNGSTKSEYTIITMNAYKLKQGNSFNIKDILHTKPTKITKTY